MPEETDGFHEAETYDDQVEEYRDDDTYQDQDDTFREEREKFDEDQEQFQETDEQYQEDDSVFREEQERAEEEVVDYQPEQPKLTPKQRWHRAYNKIVMQLNVSNLSIYDDLCRMITTDYVNCYLYQKYIIHFSCFHFFYYLLLLIL